MTSEKFGMKKFGGGAGCGGWNWGLELRMELVPANRSWGNLTLSALCDKFEATSVMGNLEPGWSQIAPPARLYVTNLMVIGHERFDINRCTSVWKIWGGIAHEWFRTDLVPNSCVTNLMGIEAWVIWHQNWCQPAYNLSTRRGFCRLALFEIIDLTTQYTPRTEE